MKKKKYRINLKRFIPFVAIVVLLVVIAVSAVSCAKNKAPNPKRCSHVFENGICTKCNGRAKEYCKHSFEAGVCTICNMQCQHEYENGVCKICKMEEDPKLHWPDTKTPATAYPLKAPDDDYLVLVNKVKMVTANYVPDDLVTVSRYVEGVGDPSQYTNRMRKVAADALEVLFAAAEKDGIYLKLRTGYRSYTYQAGLFDSYARNYGETEANKYSAKAGQSEHQTGLACDLGGASQGYELSESFGDTPEGEWVKEHCAEYGFILRYIDGSLTSVGKHTGYIYEAWHIRYVGTEAAKIITENNWTLEEYLDAVASVK